PGWREDSLERLHEALSRQCAMTRPPDPWPSLCAELPPAQALKDWVAARFVAWRLGRDGDAGLLTGYYEPVVTGSRRREHPGRAPLYRRPADTVDGPGGTRLRSGAGARPAPGALAPYPTRAQIETGGLLAGRELVWLDDPVE